MVCVSRLDARVPLVDPAMAAVLEAMPVPAAFLDAGGHLLAFNDAWESHATPGGLMAPTDARGADHLRDLEAHKGFALEAGRDLADAIRRVLAGQQRCTVWYHLDDAAWEAVVQRVDQDPVVVLLTHLDRQADAAADELDREVAALRLRCEALEAARDDLAQRIDQGVQQASGPASSLRVRIRSLLDGHLGPLDEQQRDALESMDASVRAWWAGHAPRPVDDDLVAVVREAVAAARDQAMRAGVRWDVAQVPDAVPVQGGALLRQAIRLLVDDAVRSTPAGGTVRIHIDPGDEAVLLVADGGDDPDAWRGVRLAREALGRLGGHVEARRVPGGRVARLVLQVPHEAKG